ncbi:MAG: DUF503 domain-containing protein [Actinobacteria bacterium]|nr:DUF503 domain-containing protein [Actinomycetota bacterium]
MMVGVVSFDLRILGSNSLKEKRHVVKTLTAGLRKYNVAVAEVDHQELWQRATIAVSAVASDGFHVKRVIQQVEKHVGRFDPVEVIDRTISLIDPEDFE